MNFKNLFVSCSSSNEVNKVISIGLKLGYKRHGANENLKNVIFTASGLVFDYGEPYENKYKKMSFIDFISQYETSTLKEKIEEAKKVTGLSASALSEKLGFQHKYLTNAVREASTQRQKEIIAKLDGLIFKEENELTHDFEGKALNVNIDDAVMVSKDEYSEMYSKNTALCVEVGHLKKEVEYKNQVLDKRNAVLENHIERVNELELQLKTTQQKFIDVVDQKDKEISKINGQKFFAEEQLREKKKQIYKLERNMNNQALVYWIIILTISIASIMGFAS